MFTGIIENMNEVICLRNEESNLHITFKSAITHELSVDQSVAHNGVCLTIIDINNDNYTVTAIKETLDKTNLGLLKVGDKVNIERSLQINSRIDGHIVQGNVDQISKCLNILKIYKDLVQFLRKTPLRLLKKILKLLMNIKKK